MIIYIFPPNGKPDSETDLYMLKRIDKKYEACKPGSGGLMFVPIIVLLSKYSFRFLYIFEKVRSEFCRQRSFLCFILNDLILCGLCLQRSF